MKDQLLPLWNKLKGIIIGGPGQTKNEFFDGAFINNEVKKKVLTTQDLSYTEDYGLRELVDKSKDVLAEESITKEKKLMLTFELEANTPEWLLGDVFRIKQILNNLDVFGNYE